MRVEVGTHMYQWYSTYAKRVIRIKKKSRIVLIFLRINFSHARWYFILYTINYEYKIL